MEHARIKDPSKQVVGRLYARRPTLDAREAGVQHRPEDRGEKRSIQVIDENRDHAFGLLEMSMGQTSKQGRHKINNQTLPVACARSEAQPSRWTQARPTSNVGRQHQQCTTLWEAQHTKKHAQNSKIIHRNKHITEKKKTK